MTVSRDRHSRRHRSRSSSSSSSSTRSESCEKKEKKHSRRSNRRSCSRSRSSSRSRSRSSDKSEIECFSNDKDVKHKKTKPCSPCSSSSDNEPKFNFLEIYQYFKNKLVQDTQLMVAGSSSYLLASNNVDETIASGHPLEFNNLLLSYNADQPMVGAPYFVREDGIYYIVVNINTDSIAQITVFVNGVPVPLTCVGTNSGAGILSSKNLIALRKNDNILIRNYLSALPLKTQTYSGGLVASKNMSFCMMKYAPLCPAQENHEELKCLNHKKVRLFKKLTKKLLTDKELMMKGFNVLGSFYNVNSQTVLVEGDVVFSAFQNVQGLVWNPTSVNPEQIQILEDGYYNLFFLATCTTQSQFAFAVNNVAIDATTQGLSKGSGQNTNSTVLLLKQGDILTVRNHTSANGTIVLSDHAGGKYQSMSCILNIYKCALLNYPTVKPVDPKVEKRFECYYEKFRNYLLCKKWLQIDGLSTYLVTESSCNQTLMPNDHFHWDENYLINNMYHQPGNNLVVIEKSGIYYFLVDILTDEPQQYALKVNNVVNTSTIFGRDSGASKCVLRQTLNLSKGDSVSVVNYESTTALIHCPANAGGDFVSQNRQLVAVLLTPTCMPPSNPNSDDECKSKKDDCKPKVCKDKKK